MPFAMGTQRVLLFVAATALLGVATTVSETPTTTVPTTSTKSATLTTISSTSISPRSPTKVNITRNTTPTTTSARTETTSKTAKTNTTSTASAAATTTSSTGAATTTSTTFARFDCGVEENTCDETLHGANADGYRGCQTKTRNGNTCQKWTEQDPHTHVYTPQAYPSHGLGDHNYCRNPDGGLGIWCFTTDPSSRWDYCGPKPASPEPTATWSAEKKDWCCAHEKRGCSAKTVTATAAVVVAKRTTTVTTSTTMASTTSSLPSTTTSSLTWTTTTNKGCDTMCAMKRTPTGETVNATCKSHVQKLAYRFFLGQADSCSSAHNMTVKECPACSVCLLEGVGCGILTYPSTTTGVTTPMPACKRMCAFGGQDATCGARMKWVSDFKFNLETQKCKLSQDLIANQCSVCADCTPEDAGCVGCVEPVTTTTTTEQPRFDCDSAYSAWSTPQKTWCCEAKMVGCDETLVVEKFSLRPTRARGSTMGMFISSLLAACVAGGIALAAIGARWLQDSGLMSRYDTRTVRGGLRAAGPPPIEQAQSLLDLDEAMASTFMQE